jgi:hypothetical protein
LEQARAFVHGKPFEPSSMIESKDIGYLSEAALRVLHSRLSFWPTQTRSERPSWDKRSSLLRRFVNYGRNFFLTLDAGCRKTIVPAKTRARKETFRFMFFNPLMVFTS